MRLDEDITTIQVYKGTNEINIKNVQTEFIGEPLKLKLSPDILGRIFDGAGNPIDNLGEIKTYIKRDINSKPINPILSSLSNSTLFLIIKWISNINSTITKTRFLT